MKYCATHFTNNNLMETDTKGQKEPKVPKLYSRDRLESGGKIRFNKDNTTPADIEEFANTDHVFFALEPGDEPKKPESDFGKYRLRVPLDHPVFPQTASLIVNDQLEPHISADVRILKKYGADSPHAKEILKRHAENVGNIFVGKDMIPGLLMTAIRDSRKIRDKTGEDAKARGVEHTKCSQDEQRQRKIEERRAIKLGDAPWLPSIQNLIEVGATKMKDAQPLPLSRAEAMHTRQAYRLANVQQQETEDERPHI